MKILQIRSDVNNYQWIMPRDKTNRLEVFTFDCVSKIEEWQTVDMYVFNPKKKKGNFYALGGAGALAFDEQVLDVMQTVFEMSGEILPVNVEGATIYILNVLECINNLDAEKSTWDYYDDGTRGRVLKYHFFDDRITESSIFKIPETSKIDVLTYSGVKDADDEFYSLYMQHGFTGLIFEEIYSSDGNVSK